MCHIAAVTEVFPKGQKCIAVNIEYDRAVDAKSIDQDTYCVEGRTISGVRVEGTKVEISLSSEDSGSDTYFPGQPWEHKLPKLETARESVRQIKTIYGVDKTVMDSWDSCEISDIIINRLTDRFVQGEYKGLRYNLFIPEDYDASRKYPIVQFIHDAAVCGPDTKLTLSQGMGALVWVREEEQKKHPCFVLAPQFDAPSIVDDDWNVDIRLETAKELLDQITEKYSIDRNRIYTTGQSMGCMASIVLNVRYPDYFAASLLVAGQWDERQIGGLERQHLWMINSQGDAKAFPIMNQMNCQMEKRGARIAHKVWRADLPQEEYKRIAEELIGTGTNIIYTPYELESIADGWHSNGGEHHVDTWAHAYEIEAVRDWLFSNVRTGKEQE